MQRYDTVSIKATKTDEGFIRDAPIVGRTGLLRYLNADGSERWEYRPPEEAFKEDSLQSLTGKPITIGHQGMVTADTAGAIKPIGTVLTAGRQDGDTIRADIMIYNLPTNARELSCGYTLDLDETPGTTPDGKHYDAIQRNIKYNHLAVVSRGRAGIARLNMDGSQEIEDGKDDELVGMTKVRLDSGLEYDAAPEIGVYIEKMKQDAAEQKKQQDQLQAKYDTAIADLGKEKKAHEDADKKQKENFDTAVKERVDMLDVAKNHKIEKADSMSNKEIKVAVIKAVRGDSFSLDGKSDDYIDASFDMAKEDKSHNDGIAEQRKAINKAKSSAKEDEEDLSYDPQAALKKLQQDEADLWMKEVR